MDPSAKPIRRRTVLRSLGVAGVTGIAGCLGIGAGTGGGGNWEHEVVWDGEALVFDNVRCRSGFNTNTILAETDESEFKVSYHVHDEHVNIVALRFDSGDILYRGRFHEPPEAVEWEWEHLGDSEYDAHTAGTVTLTPNTDAAEDAHPDGAEVEFDLSC